MEITLEILDYNNEFVKQWQWDSNHEIPQKGDTLLIHFGDENEEEYRVNVLRREFDGTRTNVVRIITDFVRFLKKDGSEEETLLP